MTACVIQLLHFVIKNLHTINKHGCKNISLQFDHSLTRLTLTGRSAG